MKVAKKNSNYRPELDGLRALAVIFVIINHFSEKILPGGFLGVDIFFVLSGYVVSASLYDRPATDWYVFLSQFYARRMKRIFPALIFCVVITGFIGCYFIQYPTESLKAGMYSLAGASNIYFYSHSSDYFGEDARHNLFTHTWSLGVEEQFYLFFPALLILIGFKAQKHLRNTLLILALASFIFWIWMISFNPSFSFFMIFTRFWELGLGCITFLLVVNPNLYPFNRTSTTIAFIALAIIIFVAFMPKQLLLISNPCMCLAVAALIFFMRKENIVVRMMSNVWMIRIGILSYSLYLWHWPVISLSRHTIGISIYTIFFQIILIVLLAIFSFIFVERPFRYGKVLRNNALSILAGVFTITLSCGLLITLNHAPNTLFSANKPKFDITRPVFSLQPSLEQCKNSNEVIANEFPPRCYYSSGAKRTLWMVGDSTTWALKGLASQVAHENGFNIAIYADDSAFPSAKILREGGGESGVRWSGIRDFFDKTFNYIVQWSKPGDMVLITANFSYEFCNSPELYCERGKGDDLGWREFRGQKLSINDAFYAFLSEMGDLKKTLEKKEVQLILSAPLPRWEREHRIYCEKQWFRPRWENAKCQNPSYVEQKKSRQRLMSIIDEAKNKYGFYVYDPFPFICNEISCNFSNPKTNENYWIDETHLSTLGGKRLAPDFNSFLQLQGLIAPSGTA